MFYFNIDMNDIERLNAVNTNAGMLCFIRLKKPDENPYCLACHKKMVGTALKERPLPARYLQIEIWK